MTSSYSGDERLECLDYKKTKHGLMVVSVDAIDTGATVLKGDHGELDETEALRVWRKIDCHLIPLMCNKTTLNGASILGISQATHLSTNQLGTIFYLGYLMFQFPQNLALQRFPIAKWLSVNIFNFRDLMVVRFILGICEGFIISTSMFYTRKQTLRVGYWSQIISGFVNFGSLHIHTAHVAFEPWQMIEALLDPKTWLFALFSGLANVPKRNQSALIIASFGFTTQQTSLLGCVLGVVEALAIWTGVIICARTGSRTWIIFLYCLPNILGIILVNTLPWGNKIGLLCSVWLTIISLSWISTITAGHTKRITTNSIMLAAYSVGNALGPFMPNTNLGITSLGWQAPSATHLVCVIHAILVAENKRRDAEPPNADDYEIFIQKQTRDGAGVERVRIDKELLDLTDRQNRDFRYVY
ncbi:MFS general substrate transporter [Mycena maculata]|uniref:MFS general substrate transporter n=1 Tax=Mycena maculata TaxID=230809 RepID=A0AAD7MRG0_9AGAR|nr:MFS general substrate transporter [Mycena maculata]